MVCSFLTPLKWLQVFCKQCYLLLGQIIYATHEKNQWVYALTDSGEHGFVPSYYLTKIDGKLRKDSPQSKKSTRHKHRRSYSDIPENDNSKQFQDEEIGGGLQNSKLAKSLSFGEIELGDYDIFGYISETSFKNSDSELSLNGSEYSTVIEPFTRKRSGKYLVLHNFHGEDENDATILKGKKTTSCRRQFNIKV